MIIANEDKVRKLNEVRKHKMADRMRKPLEKLAHSRGQVGRWSAALDSYISRHEDKGHGIYAELKSNH